MGPLYNKGLNRNFINYLRGQITDSLAPPSSILEFGKECLDTLLILLEEIIWYQIEDPAALEHILLHHLYQTASQEQQDYYLDNKEDDEDEFHDTVIAGYGVLESIV